MSTLRVTDLPLSRFPDRDMTPEEQRHHESLLREGIRVERNTAHNFLRYWVDEAFRERMIRGTNQRRQVRREAGRSER